MINTEQQVADTASGFEIDDQSDRTQPALTREMRDRVGSDDPPPLGLHLLTGLAIPQRLGNIMSAVQGGILAVQIIARAVQS